MPHPLRLVPCLLLALPALALAEPAATATNRLVHEKSPYLQQHAHNPVDWYPWGDEAFARARAEHKLIFLSIGYSTCHWCHVMERESFANPEAAALLNANFVCIKVDREERPDVDRIYMTFIQATTGSGGWPMTVWLTPDLKPVFGGTYFAPENAAGRPGLKALASRLAEHWRANPAELVAQADEVFRALAEETRATAPGAAPAAAALRQAGLAQARASFDPEHGGFEGAPKFPNAVILDFLLATAARPADAAAADARRLALTTLRALAAGGIHDHLGGGFHRYTVDAAWRVPHFEKMLPDQALLIAAFLTGWQLSGEPGLRDAAADTLAYLQRDLLLPAGGFASAEDADSPLATDPAQHAEGAFYTWTDAEISRLPAADAALFRYAYGILPAGNTGAIAGAELAGTNVLYQAHPAAECARQFKLTTDEASTRLQTIRSRLAETRAQRPRPFRDDKVITSWNGLALSAFARASQVLDDPALAAVAARTAAFLRGNLRDPASGRLAHTWRDGRQDGRGFADDYAFLIQGLLDLYEANFDPALLDWAVELQERQDQLFWDETAGGYFASEAGDPAVVLRLKGSDDGAEPAANSVAIRNLSRLAALFHRDDFRQHAERTARAFAAALERAPFSLPVMIAALGWLETSPQQVVIQGEPGDPRTQALLREVRRTYVPQRVVIRVDSASRGALESRIEFIRDLPRDAGATPTAYVCENFVCRLPVSDPAALARQLSPAKKP